MSTELARVEARPQLPLHPSIIVALALSSSLLVGAVMVQSTRLGIAACVGLCYVPLALLNLPLAIVLWLPLVSLTAVAALDVGPNVAAILISFGWLGAFATRYSQIPALVAEHGRLLVAVGAMTLWMLASVAWAIRAPLGSDVFFGWLVAGLMVLVISTTLTDRRYLRLGAAAFILGMVVSVAIGLVGGAVQVAPFEPGPPRIVGGSGDPNFLAAGIVPAIVLTIGLSAGRRGIERRVVALAVTAMLTYGLVATQSRAGIIAAAVALVAALVVAKRQRARVLALVLSIVGVVVGFFSVDPQAWQRLSDFSDSSGRDELWNVAWRMWQDHPVVGVGMEGFVDNAASYVREVGPLKFAAYVTEEPKVVHNTYLELLAEAGIVGLVLYVAVVGTCLASAWKAAGYFARAGDIPMVTLSRCLVVSVLAMLTAAFFVSAGTDRRLWVLLAMGPALLAAARREAALGPSRPVRST